MSIRFSFASSIAVGFEQNASLIMEMLLRGARLVQTEVLQISISGESAAQVRDALESGEYDSADEVVLDALRNWHHMDVEHLKAAWDEAIRDDSPGIAPGPVFERVRERLAARLNEHAESCD